MVVNGEVRFTVNADLGRKLLAETREFTIESLADAIHAAYCETRGFRDGGEIHRRQHIEIARLIFEKA